MAVSAVRAAEEAQVANDRLDAVAKSMNLFGSQTEKVTDRLKEFAETNERSLAVDADIIKATQAKLLTFKNLALTADQVGGAMDRATLAAIDLAAAGFGEAEQNAIQLGKALQDPVKGITALSRSGVTFTEQEKEKIAALVETNRVLEAQDLILSAIETQVGGTAAATATGSAKMSLAFLAMQDALGEALMPVFEALVPLVTDFFGYIGDNIGIVTALAAVFAVLAVAILLVNFALNANPIVKIITVVGLLVGALILLADYLVNTFFGSWGEVFTLIGKWFGDFVTGIGAGVAAIGSFFAAVFEGIVGIAKGVLNFVIGIIEGFINTIIAGVNFLLGLINKVLSVGKVIGIDLQIPKIPKVAIPRLAEGGIVMPRPGGVLANIAEGGQAEAVIPLDRLGDFRGKAGNTYNINVSGGMATGSDIGRAVVNAIKDFERQSGTAWRG
jgi:phage-related protein